MIQTDIATSWSHLQELLFADSWNQAIGRYRSPWAFRGLSESAYRLDTTLMRLGGPFAELEGHLLRNFMKYAHRDVVERDSYWHWLSVAQHHGLPTRLLDWTHSPLIAMHFATVDTDKYESDGVVWCINYEKCHALLPIELRRELESEGANTYTIKLLERVTPSLKAFDAMTSEPCLLFLEPPSMDDRIVNQFALFSVMSDPATGLSVWSEQHPELCRKIIIPAELKWDIRDRLDQSNVTERVLFPGLDGLSHWLRRHYSPKL
jgi:hypothetical protein